ncbi:hypothetical protein HPP92_008152 [Vanilla planifolia]|uniref:non-specific serine/threonine protein kinase n=1 Tax=Vanilla planifolia TaxID=51239 RepID=A0A835VAQ7_VANPL|nr:hypothetical protein HPP92_008152 [Vanilla planifolia]
MPSMVLPDLGKLLSRLLDTNPQTRITIPEVMDNHWFKKGFRHVRFYIENDEFHSFDEIDEQPPASETAPPTPEKERHDDASDSGCESDCSVASCPATTSSSFSMRQKMGLPRPTSLNAFDIISFSAGFDLSGLFEERGEEARFVSGEPVPNIISKLEEIAKLVSFTVRKKDYRVSLEGTREGEKGPLTIAAEIFELTPSLVVVEVKKKAGDRAEYEEFYNRELKPGLQNLVYVSTAFAS